jgi:hypothetical protein
MSITHTAFTIRWAGPADSAALARLAALDSGEVPGGGVLLAEVGGELRAAVPAAGGPAIADPFHPTAALVELLEMHARRLRDDAGPRRARPFRPRLLLRTLRA